MAGAIIPTLAAGGRVALSALPTVVSSVKDKLPAAYDQVKAYFGKSATTPEAVAQQAVVKNDKFLAQATLEIMMRNGVSAEFIVAAAPMFTVAELRTLQMNFVQLDKAEQSMAAAHAATLDGDPDMIFAHDNVQIARLCRQLGVSSNVLADLSAFLTTRGPAQIHRYQAFEKANGRNPL